MKRIVNYQNIRNFAYTNDKICRKPIRGIVLSFLGLNNASMFDTDTVEGEFYAEQGVLYVIPYTDPWAWMNRRTVALTDEILDVLFKTYALEEDTPIVSTGESMGGQSAIVYCAYAKRTPAALVANCPVCDVVFHYSERSDLPRTFYSALHEYEGSLDDALKSISPLHLADKLPRVNYHIFHCANDNAVNINSHSDKFVAELRKLGFTVSYDIVPERGHCNLTYDMRKRFSQYVMQEIDVKQL